MKTIMVTGGAGYIGSHATRRLLNDGFRVVVVDFLGRGNRAAVDPRAEFHCVELADTPALTDLMKSHDVDAVMHFAALAYVGESYLEPLKYFENNVAGSISLLRAMQTAGVNRIIFSSTCATYGIPDRLPIVEETPQQPINPYGWSKLHVERLIREIGRARPDFAYSIMRYFNVAGCSANGDIGEDHKPETHLIPLLLQTALGQHPHVTVFGTDYPTPDGTCIRDYLHVDDLVDAHLLALNALSPGDTRAYNLGIGRGFSVNEIIAAAKNVTGVEIPIVLGDRREGDPPELFANADRIRRELGWQPRYTDVTEIIDTAWNWFRQHPRGYDDSAMPTG